MMDWTDRHCRFFHRQLTRHTLLYTEMVTTGAVLHGDRDHLLGYDEAEHPVALQLGGSDLDDLAESVRIGAGYGYDEINLNVGCPSDRVQSGAFGACLMHTPAQVASCVAAMRAASDAVGGPEITVKCRIGVDDQVPEVALRQFVRLVADAGVTRFIIHARMAWLKGLSPKENRTVPPLDYALVTEIREENPALDIVLNGGIGTFQEAQAHLEEGFTGVMIGRAAYHEAWAMLGNADHAVFGVANPLASPDDAIPPMVEYIERTGARPGAVGRHMLGLYTGMRGAKAWRRALSETMYAPDAKATLLLDALDAMKERQVVDA